MWVWIWVFFAVVVLFGFVAFFGAPYVPSHRRYLREIFKELYPLTKGDVLVDIGSGDGVVLREAARHGVRAVGYELNPVLAWLSKWWSRHFKDIEVHVANMWQVQFPTETTVVYVFGVERDMKKIEQKIQSEANRLGKPLKLISHGLQLSKKVPVHTYKAYFLYDFIPLQSEKHKV